MKTRSNVHSGQCSSTWQNGTVKEASGGGYYGEILDKSGNIRYFNMGYTQFVPDQKGVAVGQNVPYTLFEPPNVRAGKVSCIQSS